MGRLTMAAGCTKVHHNVGLSALARSIQEQQCESREAPPSVCVPLPWPEARHGNKPTVTYHVNGVLTVDTTKFHQLRSIALYTHTFIYRYIIITSCVENI